MKKRIFGLLAALALCLALLPGAASAEETGVKFANGGTYVHLTDGKTYVAAENGQGIIEWTEEGTPASAYLSYSGTTLTVHGEFTVKATIYASSDLTITGEAGSSLSVTAAHGMAVSLTSDSVLTLDGGVDFTCNGNRGPGISYDYSATPGTFAATDSYSGDIELSSGSSAPAVSGVPLDVKNSGSITITGMISSIESAVLNSTGDVSITSPSGSFTVGALTIKGAKVELINNSSAPVFNGLSLDIEAAGNVLITNKNGTSTAPALVSSAVISAGGDVEISSKGVPVSSAYGATYDLTVKNAQNVTITGESGSDAFFPAPVTFENCGNVTVTDTGTGELLGEDGAITSDSLVYVTQGGEKKLYADGKLWAYSDEPVIYIEPTTPATAYKSGDGWVFYEPAAGGEDARLTLDNATGDAISFAPDVTGNVSIVAKGRNTVPAIAVHGSVTIAEGADTLNTVVQEIITGADRKTDTRVTVYGKAAATRNWILGEHDGGTTSLTIREGAELTIPSSGKLYIKDFARLTNDGTLVNNGTIALEGAAAQDADAETVKGMNLSGGGKVTVEKTVGGLKEAYTNGGEPLLAAVGMLYLPSMTDTTDEAKGYKWEVLETDNSTPAKIVKAKLTLKEGFNAEEVSLPDAEVEIVSEGECLIGELTVSNPQKTALTLSGPGPLNIQQHVEICGGTGNSLTVAQGAQVRVSGGFTVGAAGGVDGTITVNGTLTSSGDSTYAAVRTGKLEVGSSGTLRVSGQTGVALAGKSTDDADEKDFAGALTVQPGGRFEARCDPTVILASPDGLVFREDSEEEVIVFPNGYLPAGCELRFSNGKKELIIPGDGTLFTISSDNVPRPPVSGHTHQWAQRWSSDATHHWHDCAVPGCPVTEAWKKDGYKEHVFDDDQDAMCNVCGYIRSFPEPSEPSEPSGGDSGDNSDGFYPFFPGGGKRADTASVDPAAVWALLAALEEQACPSRAFSDLDAGAWYHEAVDFALWAGLMNGYSDGTFRPGGTVSRAMLAQILYNQAGKPAVTGGKTFSDVAPGAWYAPAVAWAAQRGIVSGYADGTFRPNSGVTREQLAAMLWRSAGSPASSRVLNFTDADRAGDYALPALRWAVERGVMNGKSGGVLDPQGQATRAQTAQMLKNLIKN